MEPSLKQTQVIAFTALPLPSERLESASTAGPEAVLMLPFLLEVLLDKIKPSSEVLAIRANRVSGMIARVPFQRLRTDAADMFDGAPTTDAAELSGSRRPVMAS